MRYVLTVTVPTPAVFEAYWYGTGQLLGNDYPETGGVRFTVDYGADEYRARYQADRFASGTYYATVAALPV